MANVANIAPTLRAVVQIDSNSTTVSGTPVTVLCNRQYSIKDFILNASAVTVEADGAVLIESVTPGGVATTIGCALATGAITANWNRPTVVTLTPGTTNGLSATAVVARGNTFRVRGFAAAGDFGTSIRATGTILIIPGNRYAPGTQPYYPQNPLAFQA